MKIYTRTGDEGDTGLFGGGRVPKDDPRVEAYGSVDELNSFVGHAVTLLEHAPSARRLEAVQHDLFAIGAVLATPAPPEGRTGPATPEVPVRRIEEMERWIDEATEQLPPLKHFILPGGSPGASALHLARTVCRRAERAVVSMGPSRDVELDVIRYLNRLSDLLFAFARLENRASGRVDVVWRKDSGDGPAE